MGQYDVPTWARRERPSKWFLRIRRSWTADPLGVHWAPWIWKSYTPKSHWGLYNPPDERRFDLRGTDLPTLREQLASTRSDAFVVHQDYADALMESAAMPTVPLSFP
jgi:hypothetical protein